MLDNAGNATFAGTAAMASSFLRNRIINGGFDVWQRGTSTSSTNVYLADRWLVTAGSSLTSSQSSDVPSGFRFSLSLAGANFPQTIQRIESVNCFDLVGQSVTVSFWAKQTVGAGSNSLGIQLYSANASDNFSATTIIGSQLLNGSTSWTRYTATFSSLPAATANGLQVLIYANTAGSATFLVTGVQLEVGTAATPFERRQFGQELALCQRYYYTIRATNSPLTNFGVAAGQADLFCLPIVQFPQIMRASPTFSSSAANTFNVLGATCTQVFADIMTPWTASWTVQASGVAPTGAYRVVANSTVNAFVAFSAEL